MNLIRSLYFKSRFFYAFSIVILLFVFSFIIKTLFPVAQTAVIVVVLFTMIDMVLLYRLKEVFQVTRRTPGILSLGDEQRIILETSNLLPFKVDVKIIDEIPVELQIRDFALKQTYSAGEYKKLEYTIFPATRGAYEFGNIHVFLASGLGLLSRKCIFAQHEKVKVYPSVIQMKNMELKAFSTISLYQGVKRIRKIGHSYEFDHIKNYVFGDDSRSINWKASSRKGEVMVNHYEDERAQNIYFVINKSRSMLTPFNGLSLMDHAINTCLVMSNIALRKHDKAGLISFSHKINSLVKSEAKSNQLHKIMEALYSEKEHNLEANYDLLYNTVRKVITRRSLLLLFTNFESVYSMKRVLPVLRNIRRFHLLVVVFFRDSEMQTYLEDSYDDVQEIYNRVIAHKLQNEKDLIAQELNRHAIYSILTEPEHLTVNTLNKYLEFKAKGLI